MARILIVEDEPVMRTELRRLLAKQGHQLAEAGTVSEALSHEPNGFDLVISDLRLPGAPGTDLIGPASAVPVLIMTSFATVHSAVEAMKSGAADYLSKPVDPDELLATVDRLLQDQSPPPDAAAKSAEREAPWSIEGLIAKSPAMRDVIDRLRRVAPTDTTVLILGESGTGKELIARAIHANSKRRGGAFVAVNCAAIPEGLIEAELFGHEKGSFTGATGSRIGLAEAANNGTLFLDEVGELPPTVQGRLLRLLQEREVRPIGAARSKIVDLRVIAATHRDLPELVRHGEFREDLFFRLRVVDIALPPLRERRDELAEIAKYLLEKAARRIDRQGMSLTPAALEVMLLYDWPGNVRELENTLERAAILAPSEAIEPAHLGLGSLKHENATHFGGSLVDYFRHFVAAHQNALSETELARRLGISRKTLWERRQKFGLPRPK